MADRPRVLFVAAFDKPFPNPTAMTHITVQESLNGTVVEWKEFNS